MVDYTVSLTLVAVTVVSILLSLLAVGDVWYYRVKMNIDWNLVQFGDWHVTEL